MSLFDQYQLWREMFPPAATYSVNDVPDLSGKVILLTGGSSGIGKGVTKVLLEHNAKVYIACRSLEKAKAAADELKAQTGKTDDDLKILHMDLTDLATIKSAVESFLQQETRLDVLYNVAGVMWSPVTLFTAQGLDWQFGTNVLGHFYLTQLLLPTLLASVSSSSDKHVRVINITSNGHWIAEPSSTGGPIRYDLLVENPERKKKGTVYLYTQSKAGNVLFSNALARKYGERGIVSITLNPGTVNTDLAREGSAVTQWILKTFIMQPLSKGLLTPLYAGTAPEALALNGKYMIPWARVTPSRPDMDLEEHQEKLWSWCEEQVKKYGA